MALFNSLVPQTFDQPSNSIKWGDGRSTQLQYIPRGYTGGAGGATGEDMAFMDALRPSLDALGYQAPQAQMMSGDGSIDAGASQVLGQGYLDYLRNTYGDGDFAVGSTRLSGSDSDGGYMRNDLFQRDANGRWTPIDGSGYLAGDTGYKSDGRKVGTILASFLGGVAANGVLGAGTETAGAAGGGASAGGTAGGEVAAGNGAFLGEGVPSGVEGWDAAYNGAGGSWTPGYSAEGVLDWSATNPAASGEAPTDVATTQPDYGFDPNGLPEGSTYASDIPNMATTSSGAGSSGYLQAVQAGLGAATSLYGAHLQDRAARDALNATLAQSAQARADSAPWRIAGSDAVGLMSAGIQPGGYFSHQFDANDLNANLAPNYAFMLDQGQRANQNAAGVGGGLVGGNALQGLNKWTQDYAQNAYQQAYQNYTSNQSNIFNRLASIAGLGQTANQANSVLASNNMANANNYLTSGAAANAAGMVGATNSVNNGINNYLGWQYLNKTGP